MAKRKVADIVKVDGSTSRLPTAVPKMPLEEVQAIVGGYVEYVAIRGFGAVWCNEEGLLRGLPHNPKASRIAQRAIVGDVILEFME